MLEAAVEIKLKWLEGKGFKVLKLITPGSAGTMDRLILRPKWSPGQPWTLEVKRPGKEERKLQAHVRDDWRARGVKVLPCVNTPEKVWAMCKYLLAYCERDALQVQLPWDRQDQDAIDELMSSLFPGEF